MPFSRFFFLYKYHVFVFSIISQIDKVHVTWKIKCWVRGRYCYVLYCLIDFLLVQINQTCLPLCHFRGNFFCHYMILYIESSLKVGAISENNLHVGNQFIKNFPFSNTWSYNYLMSKEKLKKLFLANILICRSCTKS